MPAEGVRVKDDIDKLAHWWSLDSVNRDRKHFTIGVFRIAMHRTKCVKVVFSQKMGRCFAHRFKLKRRPNPPGSCTVERGFLRTIVNSITVPLPKRIITRIKVFRHILGPMHYDIIRKMVVDRWRDSSGFKTDLRMKVCNLANCMYA